MNSKKAAVLGSGKARCRDSVFQALGWAGLYLVLLGILLALVVLEDKFRFGQQAFRYIGF